MNYDWWENLGRELEENDINNKGESSMKKHLIGNIIAAAVLVLFVATPLMSAQPHGRNEWRAKAFEGCTARQLALWPGWTSSDCAFQSLQIAIANATELRTWPGTERNYQKAQADWAKADERLSDDVSSAYWTNQEGLPSHAGPNWYNNGSPSRQADLRATARRKMLIFERDVIGLAVRRRISREDAAGLIRLSRTVIRTIGSR